MKEQKLRKVKLKIKLKEDKCSETIQVESLDINPVQTGIAFCGMSWVEILV